MPPPRPKIYHFNPEQRPVTDNSLILDADQKDYSLFIAIMAVMVIFAILLGVVMLQDAQEVEKSDVAQPAANAVSEPKATLPEPDASALRQELSQPAFSGVLPEEAERELAAPADAGAEAKPAAKTQPPSEGELLKSLRKQ